MFVSLAMIVKNEEKLIERCLNSVKNIIDEIVIVDTGSTDSTINIIGQFPNTKVFHFRWNNDFSEARNYAIDQCKGDYILVLDADEYVTYSEREELDRVMKNGNIGKIKVVSHFLRDNQVFHSTGFVSRFFPKGIKYTGSIHEQLNSNLKREEMKFTVNHDGYFKKDKSVRNIPILIDAIENNPLDPYYHFQLGKEYRIQKKYKESYELLIKAYRLINKYSPYYSELVIELIHCGKDCEDGLILKIIEENEKDLINISDFHFEKGLYLLDYCLKFPEKAGYYLSEIEQCFLKCLTLKDTKHIEYIHGTSSFLAAYNLGVFYEVTGNLDKAIEYYKLSYDEGYELSKNRIEYLSNI